MRRRCWGCGLSGLILLLSAGWSGAAADGPAPYFDRLTLVVPDAQRGALRRTAEHMAGTLRFAGLVDEVRIVSREYDSWSRALAEFAADYRGDGHALLVGGSMMLGAAPEGSPAAVTLDALVPLARLTSQSQALVVATGSPFLTLDDLIRAIANEPDSVLWVGALNGESNHTILTLLADATGAQVLRRNYVPTFSVREMLTFLADKPLAVGLGGYGKFAAEVQAGRLRVLGVTAASRFPGVDAPTLLEKGLDVVYLNWRGVFGAPETTAPERERLAELVRAMVAHPHWREGLGEQLWVDQYLPASEFEAYLRATIKEPRNARPIVGMPDWAERRLGAAASVAAALLALLVVGGGRWRRQRRAALDRERALNMTLAEARAAADRHAETANALLKGLSDTIDLQFNAWSLTPAEQAVGLLLLKGMRHKEIADIRQTSDRTVRQQALAIYRKAGIEGRTELAAYFLEDFMPPPEPGGGAQT